MAQRQTTSGHSDLRLRFPGRHAGSFFEIEAWMPSEIQAISPLVNRLMRLIEGSRCVAGEEPAVELALWEALNNAVVHGNRMEWMAISWFRFVAAVTWEREYPSSSRTKGKDLTRMRFPIP
jgi:hypothetical protein